MADYPLLFFPEPQGLDRVGRPFPPPKIHYPSSQRQTERLSPLFDTLRRAFETRRVEIQQTPEGIDPEQVIVFETIGTVDNFLTAIKNTKGLEWMGEIELDDLQPTEDFYFEKAEDRGKSLSGRLFLTMTNQRALNEMLSLWQQYSENPDIKFRRGLAGFKSLFQKLKNIRRWDVQDRLIETGILNFWQQQIERDESRIRFELQLWYNNSEAKRQQSHQTIISLIESLGGQHIISSVIQEIAYHALLVELPVNEIQNIIDNPNTQLVRCDDIMFFRPSGQIAIKVDYEENEALKIDREFESQPTGEPVAALLDGMPMENHRLLANRLVVDDPDNYGENYEAQCRLHGTGMSSLIIYGDLNDNNPPISTPLYVRPVMKLKTWLDDRIERVPDSELFVDLLHRAVKRIFDGDADSHPIKSIKIINLSIGDSSLLFYHTMSPVARLLDWLSFKYDVLFIISAGNHLHSLELSTLYKDFKQLNDTDKEKLIYQKVVGDIRNRRLLSPSESINNITVGSIHYDNTMLRKYDRRINPSSRLLPNVHSAFGGGYRKAIKPDMVFNGGRQFFNEAFLESRPTPLVFSCNRIEPGQLVAAPSSERDKTIFTRGTSNATALITRGAIKISETLKDIFQDDYNSQLYSQYIPLLIKVMLAHGCSWGEIETNLYEVLREHYTNAEIKNIITRWIGYGIPDINKVTECTAQRVTVLGFGELESNRIHLFRLPLPPSLSSTRENRKLTITLGWFSPIQSNTQKYRVSSLYFEAENKMLGVTRNNADQHSVKRGTLQHEIFVGEQAVPFEDGSCLGIQVICKKDAVDFTNVIPYALAVTLEVAEEVNLPIYQEVKSRLITPIAVEQSV
ncbi:hypothetical protein CS543_09300 [Porphyromonas gingivalis]|uniref:S8 family peptidase n=1 Tax=Porphyromonas gingivalis TaxID=837 RepID=UPI000C18CC0E|nr:S8 family peptidase [Porphyromonas gingivalis]ATS10992.1 hypothetical protein CS543_09300 [Porphyromonas gingivalis]